MNPIKLAGLAITAIVYTAGVVSLSTWSVDKYHAWKTKRKAKATKAAKMQAKSAKP